MGIAISLYMSFVLYGGPIYHEFWVRKYIKYLEWQFKEKAMQTLV